MKIPKGSKLVMIGDSITDAGRGSESLGNGYVAFVDALIGSTYPEHKINIVNKGISGNTVRDLKRRWQLDVLDLKPNWLSIMIGINDVWQQFGDPNDLDQHIYIDEYTQTLSKLIEQTLPYLQGLILLTPYYIEPNRKDPMRIQMNLYGQAVHKLADQYKTIFVDTQKAFDNALSFCAAKTLAEDKVHPNQVGHMIIARAFLQAIDFAW